ncbi:4'-phosphopantetheinyl transferase family protein [Hespellia stercorisuis]|uniref:4'-phosphopantetheinyl transferase superfamily protein n=1 Tax=Hespellia stercorisuis DSM 15480 TaxID=1121950 RepID=A0A1M6J1A0_9FIRM|nr:4'-phosphopantetheinyl transferase superfamily protein [Hespellia stercorisuis]SHJ40409.1 4'-phosphopantetheinyl transferase superfamily protein [Hespellia stercorisuis DSM 15480]
MIKTWIANIDSLREESRYHFYYENVPAFRRQKADKQRQKEDKLRSIGVWALLARAWERDNIDKSRPFNLSHSGDYVMCSIAVDEEPGTLVGCDVESMNEKNEVEKIANHFFCPQEQQTIRACETKGERSDTFYRYWVLKESFMKATRQGTALDLHSFEFELSDPPVLVRQPEGFAEKYYCREYMLEGEPYKFAVCSTCPVFSKEMEMVKL